MATDSALTCALIKAISVRILECVRMQGHVGTRCSRGAPKILQKISHEITKSPFALELSSSTHVSQSQSPGHCLISLGALPSSDSGAERQVSCCTPSLLNAQLALPPACLPASAHKQPSF